MKAGALRISADGIVRFPAPLVGQTVSQFDRLVTQLFRRPGDTQAGTRQLLARAASAHLTLLKRAAAEASGTGSGPAQRGPGTRGPGTRGTGRRSAGDKDLLPSLLALVERMPRAAVRERLLLDPAFVEGLHMAVGQSASLAAWHRQMAEPSVATVWPPDQPDHIDRLGNSWLALELRDDPTWQGEISLRTDLTGRLRFPLCDWSIELGHRGGAPNTVLADERVTAWCAPTDVRLTLGPSPDRTLIVVDRDEWLRMIVANDDRIDARRISMPASDVAVRLLFAGRIPGWEVRYDPIAIGDASHAGLTGGLAAAILNASRRYSASIASEFDRLMTVVRGFELDPGSAAYGTIHSFSDPTLPRVMGFNVPYASETEPLVSPFCFTWFGHELGHTKSYLIETILHVLGLSLTSSPGEYTGVLARYGRRLPVRTLLQIPYTHLYEWVLLREAMERRFCGLPWTMRDTDDPLPFGEEIHREIEEAFERIGRDVGLTECGHAVVARLWALSKEARADWERAYGRWKPVMQD